MHLSSFFSTAILIHSALAASLVTTKRQTEDAPRSGTEMFALAAELDIDLAAAPAWEPIPALGLVPIVTGPNLPTVKELGLTWADLTKGVDAVAAQADGDVSVNALITCYGERGMVIYYPEALQCYNYLRSIPDRFCVVPPATEGRVQFCSNGHTRWMGWGVIGRQGTTCLNVANGGKHIMDSCWGRDYFGQSVLNEGHTPAYGNENVMVGLLRA